MLSIGYSCLNSKQGLGMNGDEQGDQPGSRDQAPDVSTPPPHFSLRRFWPVLVLISGLLLFLVLDGPEYFTLESLRLYRANLTGFVSYHTTITVIVFAIGYAVMVAFSLPGAMILSVTAGFLFGTMVGTGLVVVGATVGATAIFLIAKTALGDPLRARAGPLLKKMEAGFQKNALSYLLILRLVPLFPFFLVNLVPAFLGVKLHIFMFATAIGIIPGTFVFVQVGTGLNSILDSGEKLSVGTILSGDVLAALIGLAVLSALPVVYKFFQARNGKGKTT